MPNLSFGAPPQRFSQAILQKMPLVDRTLPATNIGISHNHLLRPLLGPRPSAASDGCG